MAEGKDREQNNESSELRCAEDLPTEHEILYNKSFKVIDGKITPVPYGTKGSQRPDYYDLTKNKITEVKNYTITTSSGRKNLANNIANQYNDRMSMFLGVDIEFQVDVVGQDYTEEMLADILDLVEIRTGRRDLVLFMRD